MRAGQIRSRIVIQAATESPDAAGQLVKTWATLTTVWAQYRYDNASTGEGTTAAGGEVRRGVLSATFRVRYSATLASLGSQHRVVYGGSTWDITGVAPDDRNRWLMIYATRRTE